MELFDLMDPVTFKCKSHQWHVNREWYAPSFVSCFWLGFPLRIFVLMIKESCFWMSSKYKAPLNLILTRKHQNVGLRIWATRPDLGCQLLLPLVAQPIFSQSLSFPLFLPVFLLKMRLAAIKYISEPKRDLRWKQKTWKHTEEKGAPSGGNDQF